MGKRQAKLMVNAQPGWKWRHEQLSCAFFHPSPQKRKRGSRARRFIPTTGGKCKIKIVGLTLMSGNIAISAVSPVLRRIKIAGKGTNK